jgi:polyferredoxin
MRRRHSFLLRKLLLPAAAFAVFWSVVLLVWRPMGALSPPLLVGAAGLAMAIGVGRYIVLPKGRRSPARRLVFFAVGTGLFGAAIWTQHNVQIEGLFFGLLAGVLEGAVVHYLIAKIAGPLLFGRIWCGWACWFGAFFDLLPYRIGGGSLPIWGRLRYAHFGLSLALVALLWYGVGYRSGAIGAAAIGWFLIGSLLYYLVGSVLAFILKDNRAFCKYACPITVPLKLMSRFALLKVVGDPARCEQDQACVKICPMDIPITDYITSGQRVLSTECILCQECINACAHDALKLSFGLDGGARRLERRGSSEP